MRTGQLRRGFLAIVLLILLLPGWVEAAGHSADHAAEYAPVHAGDHDGDVWYFILVDRFADGNAENNAGVDRSDPRGFHGGDLAGVMSRLDYLQQLGITTLWLSPLQMNRPMRFFDQQAYHGYWIWDFFSIDPRFGTMAELKALRAEMRRRGMKLIMDVVVNHAGYNAPMAEKMPHLFHQTPEIKNWDDQREREENRIYGLPDFASNLGVVKFFFLSVARFLLSEFSPDGFRLDAVRHVPLDFWAFFNRRVKDAAGPGFFLLGEQLDGNPSVIAETWKQGGFCSLFDYPLYYTFLEVIARKGSCRQLALRFAADEKYPDPGRIATFLDNHDMDRFLHACGGDFGRYRLALALLLVIRGIPVLYYGDETGMTGAHDHEVGNRAAMKFGQHPELLEYVRDLIRLRRQEPALQRGQQRHLFADDSVLAFSRLTLAGEGFIVVLNNNPAAGSVRIPLPAGSFRPGKTVDRLGKAHGVIDHEALIGEMPGEAVAVFPAVLSGSGKEQLRRSTMKTVTFTVSGCPVAEGETVFVIGSRPEIADWSLDRLSQPMTRTASGEFALVVDMPDRAVFEWKCVKKDRQGKAIWPAGGNEYVDLSWSGANTIQSTTWK
jgi:glycosidase